MNKSTIFRYLLLIPIALLLIYVTWYLKTEGLVDKKRISREPLLEIGEFTLIRYSDLDDQSYTLSGKSMTHYDDERGSIINTPFLTSYQPLKAEPSRNYRGWTAAAKIALINEENTEIFLDNEITLTRYSEEQTIDTIINTDNLLIEDRGGRISNHAPVSIRSQQGTLSGIGVIGYPNEGTYSILKDIKTTYETDQTKNRD